MTLAALAVLVTAGMAGFIWLDGRNLQAAPALPDEPIILAQAEELMGEPGQAPQEPAAPSQAAADAAPEPEPPRALLNPDELDETEAHLCFFSLNNPREYRRMRWFANAINKHSPIKIRVSELQADDAKPVQSFRSAIENNIRCDGVVLSGHFTDEYYGDRASGDLELDDLEELCCSSSRNLAWFAQVKALWLEGCNTIKYSDHNEDVDDDDRISGSPLPFMVKLIDVDDMEDTVEDIHDLLLENINEDNFALHFQRIFPEATVYGWTDKAPGEKAGSDRSIPYHIAQTSRVIDSDPRVFSNPLTSDIPPDAARRYAEVVYGLLKRPLTPRDDFPPELSEKNFIQGWKDHGSHRYRYAFDNPYVKGYPALIMSDDEVLRQTKGMACLEEQIDNMKREPNLLQLARHILDDPQIYQYNSLFLEALLSKAGPQAKAEILGSMRANEDFVRFVEGSQSAGGYRGTEARRLYAQIRTAQSSAEKEPAARAQVE